MAVNVDITGLILAPTVGVPEVEIPGLVDFQKILYVEDLDDVFMNLNEFAISIRYFHSSLNIWEVYPVIFDDPHASVSLGDEAEFNTLRPQFQISEAVLRHRILKKDRIRLKGTDYLVEDFVSDGVGVTTVYLRIK